MELIQQANTVLKACKYKRYTIWLENSCKSMYGTVDKEWEITPRRLKLLAEAFLKRAKSFSHG